jgi:hypothetical protein
VVPETYVPYLLHKEAKRLRKETGDERWHSASEHPDHKPTLRETLDHTVLKVSHLLLIFPLATQPDRFHYPIAFHHAVPRANAHGHDIVPFFRLWNRISPFRGCANQWVTMQSVVFVMFG